jgi:hypothetical protein
MTFVKSTTVKSCQTLLEEYQFRAAFPVNPEKIVFQGVDDHDVYNITAPFSDNGEFVIAGRVEPRDSEHSQVRFFTEGEEVWHPLENSPVFDLQDPFFTKIGGELVLGGVEIFPHPTQAGALGWRTVFYKGKDIAHLERFAKGPDGMKDIRLVELKDGSIGVFTRPQGEKGGRGKIGYTHLNTLEELNAEVIENAPLIDNQFLEDEWGGANECHLLSNGLVGVLGHIACFDENGDRHYYPMTFVFNPDTKEASPMTLLAVRDHFLPGPAKRPDLVDVVFSGGLKRIAGGKAELYAGISDADAQKVTVPDPFISFE